MNTDGFKAAYADFTSDSSQVESAIDAATHAAYGGGGYTLELFSTGTWRLLPDNAIGNLYNSEGIMIGIPTLAEDETATDASGAYYDNARDELDEKVQTVLTEYERD